MKNMLILILIGTNVYTYGLHNSAIKLKGAFFSAKRIVTSIVKEIV